MESIGFLGLGAMGAPMAWNVREAGFDLRVYNRTAARTEPFADAGVAVADSPRALAAGSDAVVVMVSDGDALHSVLEGDAGILAGLEEDAVLVNASTVSPEATAAADEAVRAAGGAFLDAPVAGTVGPAEEGTLTVLAAGPDDVLERTRELLETWGDPVVDCGDVGAGTDTKLAVNLLLGNVMQGLAESLTFARARGLSIDHLLEVLGSGGLHSPYFDAKGGRIRDREFDPDFTVDLLVKDLSLALDAAGEEAVPLPATAAAREAAVGARGLGHGDEDMAAVVRFLEETAGLDAGD